jgi:hypothetical protein
MNDAIADWKRGSPQKATIAFGSGCGSAGYVFVDISVYASFVSDVLNDQIHEFHAERCQFRRRFFDELFVEAVAFAQKRVDVEFSHDRAEMALEDIPDEVLDFLLVLFEENARSTIQIFRNRRDLTGRNTPDDEFDVIFIRDIVFVNSNLECASSSLKCNISFGEDIGMSILIQTHIYRDVSLAFHP